MTHWWTDSSATIRTRVMGGIAPSGAERYRRDGIYTNAQWKPAPPEAVLCSG